MAALQQPEIQFAQRLASNEKPIRSKAIKKLRKYIIVRSHKSKGRSPAWSAVSSAELASAHTGHSKHCNYGSRWLFYVG